VPLSPSFLLPVLLLAEQTPSPSLPEPPVQAAPAAPRPRRNALSAAAAVVPGLLVHGSGHFAGGDRRTAGRLLAAEAIGLGGVIAGLGGLAATGASRRFVAPIVLLTVAGAALLTTSAAADLYGVLAPPGGTGQAPVQLPALEASGGALFVRNPVFAYRWLSAATLDLRSGGWRLAPRLFTTADTGTLRAELRGSYRLRGARAGVPGGGAPGRTLDLTVGLVHHRESEGAAPFDTTTGEVSLDGRLPLDRFASSLAGSFLEWGAGLAVGSTHYGGAIGAREFTDGLLARFGYGFYLGPASASRGEVLLSYDNRHDDFAGGLKMPGLGSGPVGHFGVEGTVYLAGSWGLRALAQAGSAHVLGLSLAYRRQRAAP
jgi:hypothetical protein